ncbi:MAG: phage integrase SAM-like domain-containing protein [Clostridia bacterium]|nr:phage integrase SAM-like domain-containing protein [Clostridia bacterium]
MIKLGESKCTVPTVREFVEQVFRKTYVNPLAPKTVANYSQYLKNNILPFLGDMRLGEVSVSTIQDFDNWMAQAEDHGRKKNLNRRSIERIGGLTSRIFKVALEMKLIDDTPFKNTLLAIRAKNARHHKALSDEEMMHVKQEIPKMESERERLYMGLLAYTGMRLEEILGLCWENINLQGKFCREQRIVTYPKTANP